MSVLLGSGASRGLRFRHSFGAHVDARSRDAKSDRGSDISHRDKPIVQKDPLVLQLKSSTFNSSLNIVHSDQHTSSCSACYSRRSQGARASRDTRCQPPLQFLQWPSKRHWIMVPCFNRSGLNEWQELAWIHPMDSGSGLTCLARHGVCSMAACKWG